MKPPRQIKLVRLRMGPPPDKRSMPAATPTYPLPRAAPLRRLVDPGLDLPADDLRIRLLATLMSSPASASG